MAYVFGTSACTMSMTAEPIFVQGVWDPYHSAMVPGLWLNEGGQSAAGAAIDHLVRMHPASKEAEGMARDNGMSLSQWLSAEAEKRGGASSAPDLVGALHVVPEFLGNRAPFADPDARGLIAGLGIETSLDSLVALYPAGLCGLGYGARQILQAQQGHRDRYNRRQRRRRPEPARAANPCRCCGQDRRGHDVPRACAPWLRDPRRRCSGQYSDLSEAMLSMSEMGETYRPDLTTINWHEKRFKAFEMLQQVARTIQSMT